MPRGYLRWRLATVIVCVVLVTRVAAAAPIANHQQAFFIIPTWGALSSPHGWRHDPFEAIAWRYHWGIDIAAIAGTPVVASATGIVRYVGVYGGYGGLIVLDHAGDWQTVYGHLSRMTVGPGQPAAQGTVIGAVGTSGHSTGPHLHFEIRYRGIPVDPLRYLDR